MLLNTIRAAVIGAMLSLLACSSDKIDDLKDDIEDTIDSDREEIDVSKTGLNAFVNDSRFGSIAAQFIEVRDTLKIGFVRVLFNFDDNVAPTPSSGLNFSFYDDIVSALPPGIEAIVVLTGIPSWMSDSSNWEDNNPRATFVEKFIRPVAARYGSNGRIAGFEIWNEPNMVENPDNGTMGIDTNPENYVELLALGHSAVKDIAGSKLVISASTTAINQNFPDTFNYNVAMRDAGAESFLDKWGVHYYGKQFENVVRSGGIEEFLDSLGKGIWITESGAQGHSNQIKYVEETWHFLFERFDRLERIYYYQFTEDSPFETSYGLKNLEGVSDLYEHLRLRD